MVHVGRSRPLASPTNVCGHGGIGVSNSLPIQCPFACPPFVAPQSISTDDSHAIPSDDILEGEEANRSPFLPTISSSTHVTIDLWAPFFLHVHYLSPYDTSTYSFSCQPMLLLRTSPPLPPYPLQHHFGKRGGIKDHNCINHISLYTSQRRFEAPK